VLVERERELPKSKRGRKKSKSNREKESCARRRVDFCAGQQGRKRQKDREKVRKTSDGSISQTVCNFLIVLAAH